MRVKALTRGELALSSGVTGKDAAGGAAADTGSLPGPHGSGPADHGHRRAGRAQARGRRARASRSRSRSRSPCACATSPARPPQSLKLNLSPALRNATGYNPSAPFPLQLTKAVGPPETPLTNATAHDLPVRNLANGEATDLTFIADAANKAIVDVRAVARGVAVAAGSLPRREISGNGAGAVRIDQPKLVALTADDASHVSIKAGQRWTYSGHVENLSPDTRRHRLRVRQAQGERGRRPALLDPRARPVHVRRLQAPGAGRADRRPGLDGVQPPTAARAAASRSGSSARSTSPRATASSRPTTSSSRPAPTSARPASTSPSPSTTRSRSARPAG